MEEEQRLRGRLSRRRPPAGGGPPHCRPWYLLESGNREPWAALLRSTLSGNADSTLGSQPLPPPPALPSQEPLPDPETIVPPEAFTVGSKTFPWTPFPPALGGSGSSCQGSHGLRASPTPSPGGSPASDSCATPSAQEHVPVQNPPMLLNCPLCQEAFGPTLSQMDVDSHLAQCLAESIEDVVW